MTSSFLTESSCQLPRRLIQTVIETRELRIVSTGPTSDFNERSEVDAVEASKAVLFGELSSSTAERIGGVQGQM